MFSKDCSQHLKQTFPPIIWIFTQGEGDGIKSRISFFLNLLYLRGQSVVGQECRDPKKSVNQCSRIACWSRCYWKHCYHFRFRRRPFVHFRGHQLPGKRHWDPVHRGLCSIHPRYRSKLVHAVWSLIPKNPWTIWMLRIQSYWKKTRKYEHIYTELKIGTYFCCNISGSSAFILFMGSSGSGSKQDEPTLKGIWGELIQSTDDFVQFTPGTVQSRFMLLGAWSWRTHERFECWGYRATETKQENLNIFTLN